MTARTPIGPLLRAFFADHLVQQKAASPQTIHAYRDVFRLLFTFLGQHRRRKPEALTLDDLDAPVISSRSITAGAGGRGVRVRVPSKALRSAGLCPAIRREI